MLRVEEHVLGPSLSGLDNLAAPSSNPTWAQLQKSGTNVRHDLLSCLVIMKFSFLSFLTFCACRICDFSIILLFNMAENSALFYFY